MMTDDDDESMEEEEEEQEDDETMKIQRILACRTETRKRWREICEKMNSSELTDGSRWYQGPSSRKDDDDNEDDDNIIEERFLVKWNELSYLHASWETQQDLLDQVDNAKSYINTFFRKSVNGILFTPDERKDGDYFDPGYIEIDRILEVSAPTGHKGDLPTTWEEEQAIDPVEEFEIVLDKSKKSAFESGAGRQFLVKFTSLGYSELAYEFERDLMLLDVDFKDKLKEFYERTRKPTKSELTAQKKAREEESRKHYVLFGEKSNITADNKNQSIDEYKHALQKRVYLNGGQLRDYQAEGIAWFLNNYVNDRSCIMADEVSIIGLFCDCCLFQINCHLV